MDGLFKYFLSCLQHLRAFVVSQWAHLLLFLVVNVLIGSAGILSPIAVEYFKENADLVPALKKQLETAGAYTFAIAFLASAVSLLVSEYLEKKEAAKYRPVKVVLSLFASILVLISMWSTGMQALDSRADITAAQTKQISNANTSAAKNDFHPVEVKSADLSRSDKFQIWVTGLSIAIGFLLFVLFQSQAPSMQDQLNKYINRTKVDALSLGNNIKIGGN